MAENNTLPGHDLTSAAIALAPDAPPLYSSDGSLNWAPDQNGNSTWASGSNPLASNYNTYINKNNSLISNATLSYHILSGLEITGSFGYTNQQVNESVLQPLIAVAPASRPFTNRNSYFNFNNSNSWIIEPQIKYDRMWGKGKFEALIGTSIQQNDVTQESVGSTGYSSDLILQNLANASLILGNSNLSTYKYNAAFSRLSYNWDEKYLIDLAGRRDGSSRFGQANEFSDFASSGIAWIFSKERFFEDKLPALSFGKLKASYGTTGNDQIGNYQYLSLYAPYGQLPYQSIVSIVPQGLTNPYLEWEKTDKLEFGLDLGFINDRILLNGTYVRNRSSNQLLGYALPIITGFTYIDRNFPATVQNAEWEFSLNTVNIRSRNVTWSTRFNLTIPRNKLVSFENFGNSSYTSSLEIGKPLQGYKVFHFLGVNDTTGVYQFADAKGNPTSNPSYGTDNNEFISLMPKFYGGFENILKYKGFQLDILFQFVDQTGRNDVFGNYPGGFYSGNQPIYVLDRWQKPGDHALIQRYTAGYNYNTQYGDAIASDAAFSSASFVRLKNMALSWGLPSAWANKARLQTCRIYAQGQNLLTITSYKGMDPEVPDGNGVALPPLRVLTMGIELVF